MKQKDISDAQVLTQLKTRKLRLQLELERVELAIKAFENIKEIDPLDAALYEVEEPENNIDVQDDLAAAILLYNPKMSAEKKIEYALKNIGIGDTHEITQYLLKIDGHIKETDKLFNNITYVASRMHKSGKLKAEKIGRKNKYRLKN